MSQPPRTLKEVLAGNHSLFATCRHAACRFRREADIERLVGRLGGGAQLLARPNERHFSDLMRCPSCKRMGMDLWLDYRAPTPVVIAQPNFRILDWGKHPHLTFNMIATADNLFIGRAAFVAAAHFYSDRQITFQQGAFVLNDSKDGPIPEQMTGAEIKAMRELEMDLGMPTKKDVG